MLLHFQTGKRKKILLYWATPKAWLQSDAQFLVSCWWSWSASCLGSGEEVVRKGNECSLNLPAMHLFGGYSREFASIPLRTGCSLTHIFLEGYWNEEAKSSRGEKMVVSKTRTSLPFYLQQSRSDRPQSTQTSPVEWV